MQQPTSSPGPQPVAVPPEEVVQAEETGADWAVASRPGISGAAAWGRYGTWILVCVVVVLALATRLPGILPNLWFDEIFSAHVAESSTIAEVLRCSAGDSHPPLYYVLLHYWVRLGSSDQWARMLSLLLGLCILPVIFGITYDMCGRRAAWRALLLGAAAYPLCWVSYELRNFVLLDLTAALAWWALVRTVKWQTRAAWICFAIAVAASWYSFYHAFYVSCALGAFALVVSPTWRCLRGLALSALAVVVLFLPWVPSFASQLQGVGPRQASLSQDIELLFAGGQPIWKDSLTLCGLAADQGPWGLPLRIGAKAIGLRSITEQVPLFVLAGALGVYVLWVWPRRREPSETGQRRRSPAAGHRWLWGILAMAATYVLCVGVGAIGGVLISERYLTFLCVMFCVGLAVALERVNWGLATGIVWVLVATSAVCSARRAVMNPAEGWPEAMKVVRDNLREEDCILVCADYVEIAVRRYGGAFPQPVIGLPRGVVNDPVRNDGLVAEELPALGRRLSGYNRVWLIVSNTLANMDLVDRYMQDGGFDMLIDKDIRGVRVKLFEKRKQVVD